MLSIRYNIVRNNKSYGFESRTGDGSKKMMVAMTELGNTLANSIHSMMSNNFVTKYIWELIILENSNLFLLLR